MEIEEISETSQKRVKMRDLESVFRSEGTAVDEFPFINFAVVFRLWYCLFIILEFA